MLKRQQFKDNRGDKTKSRRSKFQHLDENENAEKNGLDKNESEIEDARYILPLFIPLPLPWKMLNRPLDLCKGTKSLNHLLYIPKICYSRNANFPLKFPSKKSSKALKKIYTSCIRERLKSYLASITSTASVTTNNYRLIRDRLKSHRLSNYRQDLGTQLRANQRQVARFYPALTGSSVLTNVSNIPKVIFLSIKASVIGRFLQRRHWRYFGIKNSIPTSRSLCKYT